MSISKEIEYAKEYTQIYNECKEEFIEKACDIFADIINEVIPINASDMPYIKKFREELEK